MAYRYNTNRLDVEFRKRIQNLEDDTSPSLGGDLDLNNYAITGTFTAGENLSDGDLCCLDGDGEMVKADASNDTLSSRKIGIAAADISANDSGVFYLRGYVDAYVFSPGDILYVSTTAGTWQNYGPNGSGEIVRIIGYAVEQHLMFLDPGDTYIEVA